MQPNKPLGRPLMAGERESHRAAALVEFARLFTAVPPWQAEIMRALERVPRGGQNVHRLRRTYQRARKSVK